MKKIISSLSLIAVCAISSCTSSNDDITASQNLSPEQVAKTVNLVSNKIEKGSNSSRVNVIIFQVSIGRASQNCLRGWGFCNFKWFPLVSNNPETASDGKLLVEEQKDAKQRKFFEIHAGSAVPNDIPNFELSLIVDNDMTTVGSNGEKVTLKKGTYLFDRNIGDYGGYRINLN